MGAFAGKVDRGNCLRLNSTGTRKIMKKHAPLKVAASLILKSFGLKPNTYDSYTIYLSQRVEKFKLSRKMAEK